MFQSSCNVEIYHLDIYQFKTTTFLKHISFVILRIEDEGKKSFILQHLSSILENTSNKILGKFPIFRVKTETSIICRPKCGPPVGLHRRNELLNVCRVKVLFQLNSDWSGCRCWTSVILLVLLISPDLILSDTQQEWWGKLEKST